MHGVPGANASHGHMPYFSHAPLPFYFVRHRIYNRLQSTVLPAGADTTSGKGTADTTLHNTRAHQSTVGMGYDRVRRVLFPGIPRYGEYYAPQSPYTLEYIGDSSLIKKPYHTLE